MLDRAVTFGGFRLDRRNGLSLGTSEVRLTPKALALLCLLAERPGQLVTKDELFAAVWPGCAVGDAALVTCIQELRKALRDDARAPLYIETLHRRGYRFVARPVAAVPDARASCAVDAWADGILVGRDAELAQLDDALAAARAGQRQIVFVTGEPGIGKTSLLREFAARAGGVVDVVFGQAAEHYGASEPYLPVLEALTRLGRAPATALRLLRVLQRHAPSWLAQLPSLLDDAQRRALGARAGTDVTRSRMLRELTEALETLSAEVPLLLCLEDLHWGDVSTLDWLAAFARRSEPAALLVVVSYRPVDLLAVDHPLRGVHDELRRQRHCSEIALPLLARSAVAEYVARRFDAQAKAPLDALAGAVHARTEGSPLFMVGMLDELVATGRLAEVDGRWTLRDGAASAELGLPRDLERLIEHQLDRLASEQRRLLEAASVVGAEFAAAAVAAALGLAVDDVESGCAEVARRQQLIRGAGEQTWADGTLSARFGFQHALYREALYRRIPAGRRAELHRRVGERLALAHAGRVDEFAAELAMHFDRGRDVRRAVAYLHQAGRTAALRGAAHEAAGDFGRALELLDALPADGARDAREAELRCAVSLPLIALHGYGSLSVETNALRAQALCERLPDLNARFAARRVVWNASLMRHPVPRTLAHARELMELAARSGEPAHMALAQRALGTSHKLAGELQQATELLSAGSVLADTCSDADFAEHGEHPGMICRAFAAWTLTLRGFSERAERLADDAIAHGRRRRDPHGIAFALVSCGMVFLFQRRVDRVSAIATEVLALAQAHQLPQWLGFGRELQGWAMVQQGDIDAGIELIEQGLRTLHSTGARTHSGRIYADLAESELLAGRPERARPHLAAWQAHVEAHGERYLAAELPRLRAWVLRLERAPAPAVAEQLDAATAIARAQGARLLELRAAGDRARLLAGQGAGGVARQLL